MNNDNKHKPLMLWVIPALLFVTGCHFSATGGGLVLLFVAAGCILFVMLYGSGWIR